MLFGVEFTTIQYNTYSSTTVSTPNQSGVTGGGSGWEGQYNNGRTDGRTPAFQSVLFHLLACTDRIEDKRHTYSVCCMCNDASGHYSSCVTYCLYIRGLLYKRCACMIRIRGENCNSEYKERKGKERQEVFKLEKLPEIDCSAFPSFYSSAL